MAADIRIARQPTVAPVGTLRVSPDHSIARTAAGPSGITRKRGRACEHVAMPSLVEDATSMAEHIATALTSSGYHADFSPASLWDIDRFFDEQSRKGRPRRGGLLADETGARLFALGAYTGEVIRRAIGGTWSADDADPEGEINIELQLADGSVVWPVQRVMKRLANGAEDAVAPYAAALGVDVGRPPER